MSEERTTPGSLVEKWKKRLTRDERQQHTEGFLRGRRACADELSASLSGVRAQLQGVIAKVRDREGECRRSAGIPCQSEYAWHADEFQELADTLTTIASQLGGE